MQTSEPKEIEKQKCSHSLRQLRRVLIAEYKYELSPSLIYHPLLYYIKSESSITHPLKQTQQSIMAPIVLILGSGPRVGASVAATFASNGYSVVVTSRKGSNSTTPEGYLSLSADFNDPFSIPGIFDAVATKLNSAPNVVIYNAAALTPPPDQASVFSISAAKVAADLNVNTISAFVAAEQAVKGFEKLGEGVKKTFIYTGNILNVAVLPVPMMLNLGMGKAASAYWVGVADMTFASKGYR
jgi:NAD(P)-dependent dehydrogenase (short-subunit alcohol dehydrogenase family)